MGVKRRSECPDIGIRRSGLEPCLGGIAIQCGEELAVHGHVAVAHDPEFVLEERVGEWSGIAG